MTRNRHIVLLAAFVLSAGMLCAETVVQNIHNLYNNGNGPLVVTNSNKTGTTDFVTYICSGGTVQFSSSSASNYKVSIFLTGSGAKVETTPITGLDSLTIYYLPSENKTINVKTKEGNGEWTSQTVVPLMNGVKAIKMPHVGDYALQILRGADVVYITQIDYTVKSSCNCLRVTIEE